MKITDTFQHKNIQGFKFGSTLFGRPKLFSHVYFIDGLLIDTGHSNMRKEVMNTLTQLPVDQVFITHHHEDHTGNLAQVQKHFPCPTYASSKCIEVMQQPPNISFAQWMSWGHRPANFKLQPKHDLIQTSNYNFELIPIPGHAIDMVALYEASEGWLFSADLWVGSYIKYFMRPESMKQQIESLRRVLELDFEVLLCSHNPQFKDGKKKIKKKLAFFEEFYGKAAHLHQQGHSVRSIFKEMKLKESWFVRLLSTGELSTLNMVRSVVRDEESKET